MIQVERHVAGAAIGVLVVPFFQRVLADFVAGQCALLVFDTGDAWIFYRLHIKV